MHTHERKANCIRPVDGEWKQCESGAAAKRESRQLSKAAGRIVVKVIK